MSMSHHIKGINLTHLLYFVTIVHSSSPYAWFHI